MPVIATPYNHTSARTQSGANAVGDEYRINLYTVLPFVAAATTKAAAEAGATQVATANGYTQDAKIVASLAVAIITTNDSNLDAPDVIWTAAGGSIVADFAMMWNQTDDAPYLHFDFDGTITALDTDPFSIIWNAGGISTLTTP